MLDSVLIKKQAKQLIKNKIVSLFIVSIVVLILISGSSIINNVYDAYNEHFNKSENSTGYSDFYDFGNNKGGSNSNGSSWDSGYFDGFNGKINLSIAKFNENRLVSLSLKVANLVTFIFLPLSVSIWGLYLLLIRGRQGEINLSDSFSQVFKTAFDNNYWKKFLLVILQTIIITLAAIVFLFPAFIFYYKYYFADIIMADNPDLSPTQAIKLSNKLTKGYKTELFLLDLSFIGWFLLCIITCGIGMIYVLPYYMTVKALYYENFRIRALQQGTVSQYDFMTAEEKINAFKNKVFGDDAQYNNNEQQTTYYNPPQNDYGSGMDTDYYNNIF